MNELVRRIAITIGALLIFRLGTYIPLPGIDPTIWDQVFRTQSGGMLGMFDMFAGGGISRMAIFALHLGPYLSAAIIIQLVAMVWRRLGSLEHSGEAGRRRIARYTLLLTLLFAAFQAFGVASAMQNISGLVAEPGAWFLVSATTSMMGGVFFLIWLSELITVYGIGNGLALMLSAGILVSLPSEVAGAIELVRRGALSVDELLVQTVLWVAIVALIVFVESARRNVLIEFAGRRVGERALPAQSAILPIKINSAGFLVPVTMSSWLWSLALVFAGVIFGEDAPWLVTKLSTPAHLIIGAVAIFIFVFVYTAYVLDPGRMAEQLGKRGGVIHGVEPGEPTADHFDRVASLTTVIGAIYLTAVSLVREALWLYGHEPAYGKISGGSVLIVVCTILDIQKQVRDISLTKKGGGRR